MTVLYRLCLLFIATAMLAACSTSPQKSPATASDWLSHQAEISAWDSWDVSGKIALRTPQQAESASIEWQQRAELSDLRLSGPLGMAATRVSSDGQRLTITRGDAVEEIDASSPAAVQAATGWPLPVRQLPYWLRGIPAPGETLNESVSDGLLRQLSQDGWQVDYLDYGDFAGLTLPTRIRVEGHDLSAKLIIRQWRDPR